MSNKTFGFRGTNSSLQGESRPVCSRCSTNNKGAKEAEEQHSSLREQNIESSRENMSRKAVCSQTKKGPERHTQMALGVTVRAW